MIVREALTIGRKKLTEANVTTPALDSELILGHVMGRDRLKLIVYDEQSLTQSQIDSYNKLLKLRCQSVPVAYIIGRKEFYGLNFFVKPGVLIPRPETEFVVEQVLNVISSVKNPVIADLCCGSGAISVAVAANNSRAKVYASDISDIACEVARINVNTHGLEERVFLLSGDLWSPFEENNIKDLDVVVSNPPYIPTQEIPALPKDVRHEPQISLDGGADGLEIYREIASKISSFLKPRGRVVFEIGWNQSADVKTLLKRAGFYDIIVTKDYAGFDRVITATFEGLQTKQLFLTI